jgi:hypothetical protein
VISIVPVLLVASFAVAYLTISAQAVLSLMRADRAALDATPETYGVVYESVRFPSRLDTLHWLRAGCRSS